MKTAAVRRQTDLHTDAARASAWQTLYRIGGVAALLAAVLFRRNISAEVSLFSQPIPDAVADWFALLQANRLLGLAYLDLFDVVNYALLGLLFLALYAALQHVDRGLMLLAVGLGLVGVATYFASNQALAMLSLSEQYAAAAADAERAVALAAGQALLTSSQGAGRYLSLLSVSLAGLVTSLVMLRSVAFSRLTAMLGIAGNSLVLSSFLFLVLAPTWLFLPHTLAAVPLILWQFLAGLKLLQLVRRQRA